MIFSTTKDLTYILIFIAGLTMPMRVFVGYIYAMEFLPLKNTELATAITLSIDGLGLALASFYFRFISKDWKGFIGLATLFCYLAFIYIFCTLTESPKFLVSRGRY